VIEEREKKVDKIPGFKRRPGNQQYSKNMGRIWVFRGGPKKKVNSKGSALSVGLEGSEHGPII